MQCYKALHLFTVYWHSERHDCKQSYTFLCVGGRYYWFSEELKGKAVTTGFVLHPLQ